MLWILVYFYRKNWIHSNTRIFWENFHLQKLYYHSSYNFRRTIFYKIFAVHWFCVGGMKISWFKMLFSYRNIDFWNSALWKKIILILEITPLSTQIKNPRRSRITCNSLLQNHQKSVFWPYFRGLTQNVSPPWI